MTHYEEDWYYDLIRLPLGQGHVPVPIAVGLIGLENVEQIPVASFLRDEEYFTEGFYRKSSQTEEELSDYYEFKESLLVEIAESNDLNQCLYVKSVF